MASIDTQRIVEAIEAQTASQAAILEQLKRVATSAEAAQKAVHFLERRQDTEGGLLSDWRRHESQYSQSLQDQNISQQEKIELKKHYKDSKKDRVIALLKGSCFAPCLLLLR